MKNLRKSYIIIFCLVVLSVICFGASYAIFMNTNEQHGKLNIVVGNLTYKIDSNDLIDNKITVAANEIKVITLNLYSLNDISSKYELYYTLDKTNSGVRVGYDIDTKDSVLGTIEANGKKEVTVVIRNESDSESIISFSTIGGLVNNTLTLTKGKSLNQLVGRYVAYSIGDEITLTDGSTWHVLENSSETQESVVLLSDYNLNSSGSYDSNCGTNINSTSICGTVMSFDSDNTNIYDETDSNNIGYFIKNSYEPIVTSSLPGTTNVTIPTAEQIANADGQTFNQLTLNLTNSWLITTDYWTSTARTSVTDYVWRVSGVSSQLRSYYANVSDSFGVRPVITTLKSNITEIPTFYNKIVAEAGDIVTLTYENSYDESVLDEVLCYYGDDTSTINKEVTPSNGICSFPSTASYAKVCEYNNSGLERCSPIKKLATYFIKDGKTLVDFVASSDNASVIQNTGYLSLSLSRISGPRVGLSTKDSYDFRDYGYAFIDTTLYYESTDLGYDIAASLVITNNGSWIDQTGVSRVLRIHSATADNYSSPISKDRALYFQNFTSDSSANLDTFDNGIIIIGRNKSFGQYDLNIYNVWLQLKD